MGLWSTPHFELLAQIASIATAHLGRSGKPDRRGNLDCGLQGLAPSFHIEHDSRAHRGVQCVLQGKEVSHDLALYFGDDVPRLQQAFCKAAWHNAVYYQHAGACAVYCACRIASAEYG